MADEDDLYYLAAGFDPNSLTMPKLRNILLAHNIDHPSSAKKAQLVEVFEQELVPQAKKLLKAQARVRRTSKGITDMRDSQEDPAAADDGEGRQLMPPPPAPKTPRSRKSKSDLASAAATPSTARRSKTPSRRRTAPRASDTEPEPEPEPKSTVRKSRKSVPAQAVAEPVVKLDEPDRAMKRESLEAGTSPFSDENPFQSGSSPSSGHRRVSSTSRTRKSLGAASVKKSPTKRRTTTSPGIKQEEPAESSHSTYEFPVSRLVSDEAEQGVAVTEEFTADAARELAEEERNGQVVPARSSTLVRRKKPKPAGAIQKTAPWAVIVALLGATAGWYRQEKVNVGYCGVGDAQWSLAQNPHIPEWVHENLQPVCEPCPQHAVCYPGMEVQCETDFVLQPHPLSLNGLVPLTPTCAPDSEKQRRIKAVADRAIEELREQRAVYECGDEATSGVKEADSSATEEAQPLAKSAPSKLEIAEEDLKKTVSKLRRKGMTSEEFEELWRGAIGDIMGREEVAVTRDGSGRVLLSSSSLARLPFTCAIRKDLTRRLRENRIALSLLILLLVLAGYGRNKFINYRQASAQIPGLVGVALDRLATQAALCEDGRVQEAFISVGQLRDDVLRNVFSASERERVWQSVRKIVEENANVRAATREGGKTGEWSRVWEWIGPVDLAPGLEGRRSGGLIQDSNGSRAASTAQSPERDSAETRKWDEGRPIY